jgi:exodeoxyribonuclease V alpha subunit
VSINAQELLQADNNQLKINSIQGIIRKVRFYNETNGYCILMVELTDGNMTTCVGTLPSIRINDEYIFNGEWTNHPKYGSQFKFDKYDVVLPSTTEGAVRYLSSLASGVGPAKAAQIVQALGGDNALKSIIEDPDKLLKLDFLKPEQAGEIVTKLTENTTLAELSSLVCREGIGTGTAARIYAQYGKESVQKIKENPYIISEDVFGIGFKKADTIARGMGVEENSPYRVEAAYEFMLKEATSEGHVYIRPEDTRTRMEDLLGKGIVGIKDIAVACKTLQDKGKVIREGEKGSPIYHKALYQAEVTLAKHIKRILAEKREQWPGIELRIIAQENDTKMEYAEQQKQAVATALQNPLTVITGGPGTGKSTVTKAICNLYGEKNPHNPIYLCSPTGKAAKRMEEATGREAKTIHRLLQYRPPLGFQCNEENPLFGPGLLIVDEVSMMDVELACDLFKAIDTGMTVVLVGDPDQLPSVGPGNVLNDIINSGVVPTVRLEFNYRQANGSKIAEYAHKIVKFGAVPPLVQQDGDYETRTCNDPQEVIAYMTMIVKEALEAGMKPMDIQILAPMKRGQVGVDALNEIVRELMNPPSPEKPELAYGKISWRVGDKVMVIKNDYNLGVFNGDMGVITNVQSNGITVDIDNWEIEFGFEQLDELVHAYAITTHKSQGSEFKLAIIACTNNHYIMLQRNLIYTAITRAKDRLVLLTNERALKRAVKNDKLAERLSLLKERLREGVFDAIYISPNEDMSEDMVKKD